MRNTWIIIPAYNEEKNIGRVVDELKSAYPDFKILVIDDGSKDKTVEVAKQKNINIIKHIVNRGQGAALQTGLLYALKNSAEIFITYDADGQHSLEDIPKAIEKINQGFDLVFGSRFLLGNNIPWTKKYLILKPAILLNWLLTGVKLTDAHNGFRALNKKAVSLIKLDQDRMAHATEILEETRKNKLKYTEIGVRIKYQEYGQGLAGGIKIVKDLIKKKLIK